MTRTRRSFLAAGGALLTAGCTDLRLSSDPAVSIGSIVYRNNTENEQTVQLLLRRIDDDTDRGFEVVYDEQVTIERKTLDIVEADWTADPQEYELLYATADKLNILRVPEDVSQHVDEGGCNHVVAQFAEPEGFTAWVTADPPIDDELPSC